MNHSSLSDHGRSALRTTTLLFLRASCTIPSPHPARIDFFGRVDSSDQFERSIEEKLLNTKNYRKNFGSANIELRVSTVYMCYRAPSIEIEDMKCVV